MTAPADRLPLILVAGPTASGKSALALALARSLGGMIVNADSMQVYRDLAVLTARPGPAEEALAPHRLYGVIDAADACSVGRWRTLALAAIAAARAQALVPILVGGTGLYLHALVHGIAAVPPIPAALRTESSALHRTLGPAAFHALLAVRDPDAAARLAAGDTQRVVRAYAVVTATGRTLADWQRGAEDGLAAREGVAAIVLLPPRAPLYQACDARLAAMLEGGAAEEVRALVARGLDPALPVMKAVGVRELAAWLEGRLERAAALAAAQQATRHYVKRQYTWLRHRMTGMRRLTLDAQYSESLLPKILSFIRSPS